MDRIKERETPEIKDEELKRVTKNYQKLNQTNRCFLVSASSMLLASQEAAEEAGQREIAETRTIRDA